MTDPLQIEQRFQEIRLLLRGPASARWRLMALGRFLQSLDLGDPFVASYLLELFGLLPGLVRDLDPTGLDPAACAHLLDRLVRARALHGELAEDGEVTAAVASLREATALLYACVGELESVFRVMMETGREPLPAWIAETAEAATGPPALRLETLARTARQREHPAASFLERLVARLSDAAPTEVGRVVVPVVERALLDWGEDLRLGSLRPVAVEVLGAREGGDEVTGDVAVFGAEDSAGGVWAVPASAGRSVLAEEEPSLARRYVTARVRFGSGAALHAGRSADLAVSVLFVTAVQGWVQGRHRYEMAPGVAFTGGVDADGLVTPVDAVSLAEKVRVAFCSPVELLVVPRRQLEEAEQLSASLAGVYPHRELKVVGVGHVREVFFDRRLTVYQEAGEVRHAVRWVWRRKFSVGGIAIIAVLLLVIGRLLYGPLDTNPVRGRIAGQHLELLNNHGIKLGELDMGNDIVSQVAASSDTFHPFTFADVDGDGVNEIIWTQWSSDGSRITSTLICTSADRERVFWTKPLTFPLTFPDRPDARDDGYVVLELAAGDFDDDGTIEFIALINHRLSFPSLITRYDARTGEVEEYYLHTGWLYDLMLVDLNGDGIEELIAGGGNNALDRGAVLVVLDLMNLSGHSPTGGIYKPAGVFPARERAYVRLPRTEIGRNVGTEQAIIRTIRTDRRGIQVAYHEINKGNRIWIPFDSHLVPDGPTVDTHYRQLGDSLYDSGQISRPVTPAFLQDFIEGFLYWNGEDWQREPYVDWGDLETREPPSDS